MIDPIVLAGGEDSIKLRHYRPEQLPALTAFFADYLRVYPNAKLNAPEFYTYHPLVENGDNAFCVVDSSGRIAGFAPMFPPPALSDREREGELTFWALVLALPRDEQGETIRDLLLDALLGRVRELKRLNGLSTVRLASDMMTEQEGDIKFLVRRGMKPFEEVLVMTRSCLLPVPSIRIADSVNVWRTRLESREEQLDYLRIYNLCFPETCKTQEDLNLLFGSPYWQRGTAIAAYSETRELVASVLAYVEDRTGSGVIDDVMVVPGWRGRGVAKRLVGEGVSYLGEQGRSEARLEVRASNTPAVSAYTAMGFVAVNREVLLGFDV